MDATQVLTAETPESQSHQLTVTVEFAAYLALVMLALVLRIAQLDAVPLTNTEARQALAAWRVVQPNVAGAPIIPESPLLFLLHGLSFTVLGGSELAARIFTVLASVGVILLPCLFRGLIGRTRAFIFSLILFFSPSLLAAGRTDSPLIWTLLIGGVGLWALWRYWDGGQKGFASMATVCTAAALFLTDPTGPILVLILIGAAIFALWLTPRPLMAEDSEQPEMDWTGLWRERWSSWPWQNAFLISVLTVALVSTAFMLHPAGLSAVSELLGAGLRGLTTPRPDSPVFFPLLTILFYEPVLVVFGVINLWWMTRRDSVSFTERFLFGWLVFALVASVLYTGAGPEHGLWLVMPLAGLTCYLVNDLIRTTHHPIWGEIPGWAKGLLAVALVALLAMFTIHAQTLGRSLLNAPDNGVLLAQGNSVSAIWVLIIVLFIIIGFFLAASVWGMTATAQGAALGLLAFALVTSLSRGWHIAVTDSDNPVELWNRQPVSGEMLLLRQTLNELATRESGGFPNVPVTVIAPDDGVIAWTVRDFVKTQFIRDVGEAKEQGIVMMPVGSEPSNLGASYVGQAFTVTSTWDPRVVRLIDFPAWWLEGRTRIPAAPSLRITLWLRQDIYNGTQRQNKLGA